MTEQDRKTMTPESYRQLDATCRLWIAACEARDLHIQQLEQECHILRQRVARLSRQMQRHVGVVARKQVRFAR